MALETLLKITVDDDGSMCGPDGESVSGYSPIGEPKIVSFFAMSNPAEGEFLEACVDTFERELGTMELPPLAHAYSEGNALRVGINREDNIGSYVVPVQFYTKKD